MTARLEIVRETGSTSADLLARLTGGERVEEGYWLVADAQSAGRGRHGRSWLDGLGNFMGSTAVRLLPLDPPPASLSFVAALALYEALLAITTLFISPLGYLLTKWLGDLADAAASALFLVA